jgi:hypothetical protein
MAILYVFKISDPKKAGPFPPSVMVSDWFTNLMKYNAEHGLLGSANWIIFSDDNEYNSWVNEYTLTDEQLLADIEVWKSAHGVSYSTQIFNLLEHSGNYNPIII